MGDTTFIAKLTMYTVILFQYFSLPPPIAPIKCSVLPLSNKPDFNAIVKDLCN